ncbi:hypothetical protein GCM10010503_43160 [Streptomyces lucensis JCM 4490]|uniref:Lipoprotein n=1 Tax=Streptomyces lucensis JCM 4490 TaxID=1306176 RepID=A0A918JC94_9ACTN|nr:hypothetical protein GCM10010503_43160 [Streptomyces lucensis JCM 4490]
MRSAALVAVLAGALTLTACGGDDSEDGSPSPRSEDTASATASPAVTGASAGLQGSWVTTADGKIVALVVNGKEAGLFATGGTVCSGTAGTEAGMRMIHLTCTGGGKDRTTGMVDSVGAKALKVTWTGKLGQETYTKAEGGRVPSGLPTQLKR